VSGGGVDTHTYTHDAVLFVAKELLLLSDRFSKEFVRVLFPIFVGPFVVVPFPPSDIRGSSDMPLDLLKICLL
jgi:hypothetical protein